MPVGREERGVGIAQDANFFERQAEGVGGDLAVNGGGALAHVAGGDNEGGAAVFIEFQQGGDLRVGGLDGRFHEAAYGFGANARAGAGDVAGALFPADGFGGFAQACLLYTSRCV